VRVLDDSPEKYWHLRGKIGVIEKIDPVNVKDPRSTQLEGKRLLLRLEEDHRANPHIIGSNFVELLEDYETRIDRLRRDFFESLQDPRSYRILPNGMIDFVSAATVPTATRMEAERLDLIYEIASTIVVPELRKMVYGIDAVVAPELSGISYGSYLAKVLGVKFVEARRGPTTPKTWDLFASTDWEVPSPTLGGSYRFFMRQGRLGLRPNGHRDNVLVVDDGIGTGQTLRAMCNLIRKAGGIPRYAHVIFRGTSLEETGALESELGLKSSTILGIEDWAIENNQNDRGGTATLFLNEVFLEPCDPETTQLAGVPYRPS
jgi:adenine/guanine phosphoribosyltransferase-like PRPP-binding protein